MGEGFYLHYTIHHFRISTLNLSYFLQFQTNLSQTLHEDRFVHIIDSQMIFWDWRKKSELSETSFSCKTPSNEI